MNGALLPGLIISVLMTKPKVKLPPPTVASVEAGRRVNRIILGPWYVTQMESALAVTLPSLSLRLLLLLLFLLVVVVTVLIE